MRSCKILPVSYLGHFGFPAFDFRLIFCWQTMKSSKKLALPIYFLLFVNIFYDGQCITGLIPKNIKYIHSSSPDSACSVCFTAFSMNLLHNSPLKNNCNKRVVQVIVLKENCELGLCTMRRNMRERENRKFLVACILSSVKKGNVGQSVVLARTECLLHSSLRENFFY